MFNIQKALIDEEDGDEIMSKYFQPIKLITDKKWKKMIFA